MADVKGPLKHPLPLIAFVLIVGAGLVLAGTVLSNREASREVDEGVLISFDRDGSNVLQDADLESLSSGTMEPSERRVEQVACYSSRLWAVNTAFDTRALLSTNPSHYAALALAADGAISEDLIRGVEEAMLSDPNWNRELPPFSSGEIDNYLLARTEMTTSLAREGHLGAVMVVNSGLTRQLVLFVPADELDRVSAISPTGRAGDVSVNVAGLGTVSIPETNCG